MKYLFLFLLVFTSGAAVATEPGSQYQQQAEAGDRRAQYYLADTWVSSGDYQKAEYWAQKAAAQGDGDALALLAQLKIRNPQQADYPQASQLAEKAVEAGSKSGEIVLARVLVNRQAAAPNFDPYPDMLWSRFPFGISAGSSPAPVSRSGMSYANKLSSFEHSFLLRATTAHALPGDDQHVEPALARR